MPGFRDMCSLCVGTGKRCLISGAKCWECGGTGIVEESETNEDEFDDYDQYETDEAPAQ